MRRVRQMHWIIPQRKCPNKGVQRVERLEMRFLSSSCLVMKSMALLKSAQENVIGIRSWGGKP